MAANEGETISVPKGRFTIKSLRLDIEKATKGQTWLLLPEGFRARSCGKTYQLPSNRNELQRVTAIPLPPGQEDCGTLYIKRAIRKWKERETTRVSASNDIAFKRKLISDEGKKFQKELDKLSEDAKQAVNGVRAEAEKATASLRDLFSMGRRGLREQMQAHLNGEKHQGETISASAFRQCFSMVSSAVKGLGMPSDQKESAREAIMSEVASALRDVRETISMAPGSDKETEN